MWEKKNFMCIEMLKITCNEDKIAGNYVSSSSLFSVSVLFTYKHENNPEVQSSIGFVHLGAQYKKKLV